MWESVALKGWMRVMEYKERKDEVVCPAPSSRCIITVVESFVSPLYLQPSPSPSPALSFTSFCFTAMFSLRLVFPSLSCYHHLRLSSHSLVRFLTDWLPFIKTVTGDLTGIYLNDFEAPCYSHICVKSRTVSPRSLCVCVCVFASIPT